MSTYNGSKLSYTIPAFTISPKRCTITYSCTSITWDGKTAVSITCSSNGFSFNAGTRGASITPSSTTYSNKTNPPGVYTVTFTGTVNTSVPTKTATHTATFTLKDMCNPATVTAATLTN